MTDLVEDDCYSGPTTNDVKLNTIYRILVCLESLEQRGLKKQGELQELVFLFASPATGSFGLVLVGKAHIQLKETWPVTAQSLQVVKTVSVFFTSYLISLTWFYLDIKFCNAKVVVVDSWAWHIYNERLIVFLSTYILLLTPSISWLTPDLTSWNIIKSKISILYFYSLY